MKEAATIATAIAPAIARNTRIGKYSLSRPSITSPRWRHRSQDATLGEPAVRTRCRRGRYRLDEGPGKPDTLRPTHPRIGRGPGSSGGSDRARTGDLRRDRPAL